MKIQQYKFSRQRWSVQLISRGLNVASGGMLIDRPGETLVGTANGAFIAVVSNFGDNVRVTLNHEHDPKTATVLLQWHKDEQQIRKHQKTKPTKGNHENQQ